MKDLCLLCGEEYDHQTWGAVCPTCQEKRIISYEGVRLEHERCVHVSWCSMCKNEIGYVISDDFCPPDILVCPSCMFAARKKKATP